MGIISNLDKKLTPAQVEAQERSERRKAFIAEKTRQAEAEEKAGTQQPDTVFAWQRQDAVSYDPVLDKDPDIIRRVKMLPIKQEVVMPDGTYAIDIGGPGDAAYEAARLGVFCTNCRNKQPDNDDEWDYRMRRLERTLLGPRPSHATRHSNCCYCGAELGLKGDAPDATTLGMTPEQTELMARMAGPDWIKGK